MFGTSISTKSFSFSKILGGISKTLNVANQVIPLYQQAKPLINNAKNIFSIVKEFNKPDKNTQISKSQNNITKKEPVNDSSKQIINYNNPTFFI